MLRSCEDRLGGKLGAKVSGSGMARRGFGEDSIYFDHSGDCRDVRPHKGCPGRWRCAVSLGSARMASGSAARCPAAQSRRSRVSSPRCRRCLPTWPPVLRCVTRVRRDLGLAGRHRRISRWARSSYSMKAMVRQRHVSRLCATKTGRWPRARLGGRPAPAVAACARNGSRAPDESGPGPQSYLTTTSLPVQPAVTGRPIEKLSNSGPHQPSIMGGHHAPDVRETVHRDRRR
jgi:hypothetical protein